MVEQLVERITNGDTEEALYHMQVVSKRATLSTGKAVCIACNMLLDKLEKEPWKVGEMRTVSYSHKLDKIYSLWDKESRLSNPGTYRNDPAYVYLTRGVFSLRIRSPGDPSVSRVFPQSPLFPPHRRYSTPSTMPSVCVCTPSPPSPSRSSRLSGPKTPP